MQYHQPYNNWTAKHRYLPRRPRRPRRLHTISLIAHNSETSRGAVSVSVRQSSCTVLEAAQSLHWISLGAVLQGLLSNTPQAQAHLNMLQAGCRKSDDAGWSHNKVHAYSGAARVYATEPQTLHTILRLLQRQSQTRPIYKPRSPAEVACGRWL